MVLADATLDERYAGDPYIALHGPRSVLCVAVQKLGRLVGVLYLENRALAGAFTAQRIRLMQLLATEAATALENAQLIDGLKREIGQRARAQAELGTALAQVERLKDDLEAENVYLRSELIANVSHDLRTPLMSMRGYLELLALPGHSLPAATRQSYLEIALRQSEHLATLIDELFELAKLDFKGLQLKCEPFQLAELAFDVLQKFQLKADRQQVGLRVDAPPALPPVWADLGLIERLFDNLIGNALQHTPAGGSVRIAMALDPLRTEPPGSEAPRPGLPGSCDERVRVSVRDTGKGIAAADLPFIFDRFYRGVRPRRGDGGSGGAGLGLAIAQRIALLHGGAITVASQSAAGSCFSFALAIHRSI